MLVKSLRVPPLVLVLLIICAFLVWHLQTATGFGNLTPPPQTPTILEVSLPEQSDVPRIAIATFITSQKSYIHLSLKNKAHYARAHNYTLVVDYDAPVPSHLGITYYKFTMLERLIKTRQYDWLWWLDFDTLITNTTTALTDVISSTLSDLNSTAPADIDYLVTHDCNGLNTGSFLVRAHDRSLQFLHDISAIQKLGQDSGEELSEQDAMARLINTDLKSNVRTVRIPQWRLNAFPQEIACFDEEDRAWEHGMFVLHFAGAWAHVQGEDPTGELMRKYEGDIIWEPEKGLSGG